MDVDRSNLPFDPVSECIGLLYGVHRIRDLDAVQSGPSCSPGRPKEALEIFQAVLLVSLISGLMPVGLLILQYGRKLTRNTWKRIHAPDASQPNR